VCISPMFVCNQLNLLLDRVYGASFCIRAVASASDVETEGRKPLPQSQTKSFVQYLLTIRK
jgi:hypothetical protein